MSHLAPTMQAFFTDRLVRERNASPNTIAAYRDTMRLLLTFASEQLAVEPSRLQIGDMDATLIGAFLDHLEQERHCSPRTRNQRLTAIRSLYRYAARRHPDHAAVIERVLAIPPKRHGKTLITFLTKEETDALINAVDVSTPTGRCDRAMLMLATQTGLRASELVGLKVGDVHLGTGAHVNCIGKGRKQRSRRSPKQPRGCSAPGSPNAQANPTSRCSQPATAGRSAATRSSNASPNTPPQPPPRAPRSPKRESHHAARGTSEQP